MTTKDQERKAVEKIRKIVEELGENSYVGFAMEGVLELAEDNIREDAAYSMKKNAEIAWERADKAEKENKDLKKEIEDLKKTVEERGTTISELNTELCNVRAEAKANEIPEELVQEMYCMAYDKEDGCVYLCEKPQDAAKFVAIRGHDEVAVIEVILPANKVKESFDHSVQFFQCKAFMYEEDIKVRPNAEVVEYSFK